MAWVVKRAKLNFKKVFFWNTLLHTAYQYLQLQLHVFRGQLGNLQPFASASLHNVYIVQYVFLPTEQSETYFKNFILTYDLTYICPGLFDWKENTFFFIFVKSNSKSGRFSSFLMPNNFGTGQKKAYFLGALEN